MEGGGGPDRKRKPGRIELDWDRLMPAHSDNDDPLPIVVHGANDSKKKPKRQDEAIEGEGEGDEDSQSHDHYIKTLPDRDLIDKIARVKRSLDSMSSKLPDGGDKLRAQCRKHVAELERRKRLKDDNKRKEVIPVGEESIYSVDNKSPHEASISKIGSQSDFALHFCNKLDDNGAPKSFSQELSTLNHFNRKNTRGNERFLHQQTQKLDSSSRKVPFKSPTHLSANIDEPPRYRDRSGSQISISSLNLSDKDTSISDFSPKKENKLSFRPSLKLRSKKEKAVVLVDEELEVDVENQADAVDRSKDIRIYYPSRDDPKAVEICFSDMDYLAPEAYLSSTIMNFYIRYLQKTMSPDARKRCDYHFFNTYFYEKWKDGPTKSNNENAYEKFRRWWKGVNLFEKAYIFLPIHESHHWSLVIICIPNKEDESGPIILHLDSLALHDSRNIFYNVKRFLIEEWKFLNEEEVLPQLPISDKIWRNLSRRIDERVIEVPQQKNEYDCGLFVLYFIERFIDEAPERLSKKDLEMFGRKWFKPEEASDLRKMISDILNEEFEKAKTNIGTSESDN